MRRLAYHYGWLKVYRAPVPVVVVGNITVGGNGKTPMVLAIVHHLKQQGWTPGVVSRGYGGISAVYPLSVMPSTPAIESGDEPLLIRRRSGCPVVVSPNRGEAIELLITQHGVDIVISDDGMQHYAMARDVELAVIDGARRHGNGLCLPAGPLREPPARLNSVDLLVMNKSEGDAPLSGAFDMRLKPQGWFRVLDNQSAELPSGSYTVLAGIGRPERFYQTLKALGLAHFECVSLGDHACLSPQMIASLQEQVVLMTEKDALKYAQVAGSHWYYLPVDAILPDDFYTTLDRTLRDSYAS
jgi:tetraacyldisaccharide 4'-kinase